MVVICYFLCRFFLNSNNYPTVTFAKLLDNFSSSKKCDLHPSNQCSSLIHSFHLTTVMNYIRIILHITCFGKWKQSSSKPGGRFCCRYLSRKEYIETPYEKLWDKWNNVLIDHCIGYKYELAHSFFFKYFSCFTCRRLVTLCSWKQRIRNVAFCAFVQ